MDEKTWGKFTDFRIGTGGKNFYQMAQWGTVSRQGTKGHADAEDQVRGEGRAYTGMGWRAEAASLAIARLKDEKL